MGCIERPIQGNGVIISYGTLERAIVVTILIRTDRHLELPMFMLLNNRIPAVDVSIYMSSVGYNPHE